MPKAVAFYDFEKRKDRVMAIRTQAKTLALSPVDVKTPDPIDAIAAIVSTKQDKKKKIIPALIGYMEDLHAPEDIGINDDIWIECIICLLEQEGITFHPLDNKAGGSVDLASNVIRKYHRAFTTLTELLRSRTTSHAKKYGRPPYGYHTVKGEMEVDKTQAKAVELIFQAVREGIPPLKILEDLRKKFKCLPGEEKPQFWDHVKLRRIINKRRLYCLGEYRANDGRTVVVKNLAFLPPEWVDTNWPNHQGVTS